MAPAERTEAHVGGQSVTSGGFQHLALCSDITFSAACAVRQTHFLQLLINSFFLLTSPTCAFDQPVYFYSLSLSPWSRTERRHEAASIFCSMET